MIWLFLGRLRCHSGIDIHVNCNTTSSPVHRVEALGQTTPKLVMRGTRQLEPCQGTHAACRPPLSYPGYSPPIPATIHTVLLKNRLELGAG